MNQDAITLEFPQMISKLQALAASEVGRQLLARLEPILNEDVCRLRMEETTAARTVLDAAGSPPLAVMDGLEEALALAQAGSMLTPLQLTGVVQFAVSSRRMHRYLEACAHLSAAVAARRLELPLLDDMQREIERCIREDAVVDEASVMLRNLRRKKENLEAEIREKLNHILQSRKHYLADGYVTVRNGRYVLPVQKKWQSSFGGTVVDVSGRGGTVFMEPASIRPLREEMDSLALMIDEEERRILYTLTDLAAGEGENIRRGMRMMGELDALFARAKLSQDMDAKPVEITARRGIVLHGARHPLLERDRCVPLDFVMEEDTAGVVITGPNTGGKTVAVKTVGLLCMMAQSGLHIPCDEGCSVGMADHFLCDIGDSQSITQNLSTFSGHMTNVIRILQSTSRDSLVLLDELGSGTDPAEGMGIAVAVLEELRRRRCRFLVTTHYPQVKTWAEETEGVAAARMAFNRETLQPLYRLEMGKSGQSCALEIARRLGLDEGLIANARCAAYGEGEKTTSRLTIPRTRLTRTVEKTEQSLPAYAVGDSVMILPEKHIGIVYRPVDDDGYIIVHLRGEKRRLRHTRVKLVASARDLYPEDYDFSIIFDTVENRKAAHTMDRKFDKEAVIVHKEGRAE